MNRGSLSFASIAKSGGWFDSIDAVGGLSFGMALESPEDHPRWPDQFVMSPVEVRDLVAETYRFFAFDPGRSMFLWQDHVGGPVERWVWFGQSVGTDARYRCPEGHRMWSEVNYGPGVLYGALAEDVDVECVYFENQWEKFTSSAEQIAPPSFVVAGRQLGWCTERCGWLAFENGLAAHPARASRWLDHPSVRIPQALRPPFAHLTSHA